MTLGAGHQDHDASLLVQSEHDRALSNSLSGYFGESPALTISRGDDVLKEISNTNDYLKGQEGTPWPTPDTPYGLTHIGAGVQLPPRDINVGGMTWAEALNYSPAPLTDNLGALRGPYQEPAHELTPGFGENNMARNATIGAALLGIGWFLWSRR